MYLPANMTIVWITFSENVEKTQIKVQDRDLQVYSDPRKGKLVKCNKWQISITDHLTGVLTFDGEDRKYNVTISYKREQDPFGRKRALQ